MVAGVAGGVADHLGVSDTVVRLVLIATTVFGGFGVLIYAALWFLMPLGTPAMPAAPGLAAHTRSWTPYRPAAAAADDRGQGAEGAEEPRPGDGPRGRRRRRTAPAAGRRARDRREDVLAAGVRRTGLALISRQADESQKQQWARDVRVPILGVVLGKGGWKSLLRIAVGLILIGTAITVFLVQNGRCFSSMVGDVLVALLLAVIGIGVIAGPWVHRLTRDLNNERAERALVGGAR